VGADVAAHNEALDALRVAVAQLVGTAPTDAVAARALDVLLMLTGNQIKHPVDVRYQRLNVQNVHSHRLLALPSATAVLHALGSCAPESTDIVHASKMGEASGTSGHFWLWKGGSLPTSWLSSARSVVYSYSVRHIDPHPGAIALPHMHEVGSKQSKKWGSIMLPCGESRFAV